MHLGDGDPEVLFSLSFIFVLNPLADLYTWWCLRTAVMD